MPTDGHKFTATRRGEQFSFVSHFTNKEAVALLTRVAAKNDFAGKLLDEWHRRGGTVTSMSQLAWIHLLAKEEHERLTNPTVLNFNTSLSVPGARTLFDKAKQSGLKLPAIFLLLPDKRGVKLKLAPMTGKNPNAVYVTVEEKYYGKIAEDGAYHPVGTPPPELIELLKQLDADPVGTAKLYGKITNRCCFCRLELSNLTSVYNGYGPVCSAKFGLPHEPPPEGWHPADPIEGNIER